MKSGVPPAYVLFRSVWSVVHLALLALGAVVAVRWWLTDSNGQELVDSWWAWTSSVQNRLFHLIPFPWE